MAWKVSTIEKKSVTEVETWRNDAGEILKHIIGWRWGAWIVNDDEKPDLSGYDEEEGMDPYSLGDDVQLDSMDDGVYEDWEYPASWKKKDIRKFEKLWDEEWHEAPGMMGLQEDDTEYWVRGPLEVEELEQSPNAEIEEDGA